VAVTSVGPSFSTASPSSSSAPAAEPFVPARPPTSLPAMFPRPPATDGVCSRAFSALDFRPRFFLGGPAALTWLPLMRLMLSKSTEGDRALNGVPASSGGNEVCRNGWAEPPPAAEAREICEALRRLSDVGGPPPSDGRFLVDIVLIGGS